MAEPVATPVARRSRWWRLVTWPLRLLVVFALYYAVGGHLAHVVDDEPGFVDAVQPPDGGLATIAAMAGLVAREVDDHGWVANDPVILPGHALDDMAAYQRALVGTVRARLDELRSTMGAAALLDEAASALAAPDDRWTFDVAVSWAPQKTTEQLYRDAAAALERYNAQLSAGLAAPLPDGVAARATVERFAAELAAAGEANLRFVRARGGHWLDTDVDERFMATKGLAYGQLVLLVGLVRDVPTAFAGAAADGVALTRRRLEEAVAMAPWLIMNGRADSQWRPSHLAAQAAYVERAASAMRDLATVMHGGAP